ncbi:uncharacterized protein LOC142344461 isoform X2 [Convolutriloba macropyga]|uniref:uncharacterized protein LOC142344461 isoform X2 n=1 Tax=Convolutriloba macropyga TaxID=536237 RepID=UPI003F51FEEB
MLVQNEKQETAFLKALKDSGRTEQACQLLKIAKQNRDISHDDLMKMMTPGVKVAAEMGKIAVLELCFEFGFDLNSAVTEGTTALHCAVKFAQLATIEFLLKNGARTNVKDSGGKSVEGILWGESAPSDKLNEKIKQTITKCKQQNTTQEDLPDRKLYPSLTVELGLDPNRNHPTEGEEEIQGDDSPEATEEVVGTKSENAEDAFYSCMVSGDANPSVNYGPIDESVEGGIESTSALEAETEATSPQSALDAKSDVSVEVIDDAVDESGDHKIVNDGQINKNEGQEKEIESPAVQSENRLSETEQRHVNEGKGQMVGGEGHTKNEDRMNKHEDPMNEKEGQMDNIEDQLDENEGQVNENEGQIEESGGQMEESEIQMDENDGQMDKNEGQMDEGEGLLANVGGQMKESGGQMDEREGQMGESGGNENETVSRVSESEDNETDDEIVRSETIGALIVSLAEEEDVTAPCVSSERNYNSLARSSPDDENAEVQNDDVAVTTDLEANKGEATEEVEKEPVAEGDSSRKSEMATHDENKEKIEDTKETIYSTISKDKKKVSEIKSDENDKEYEEDSAYHIDFTVTLASTLEYPSLRSSGSTVEYERPEIGDETIDENDDGINDNMLDVPAEINARITSLALGKVVDPDAGGGFGNVLLDLREQNVSVRPHIKSHLYLQEAVKQAIEEAAAEHQAEEPDQTGSIGVSRTAQNASALFNFAFSPEDTEAQTLKEAEFDVKEGVIVAKNEDGEEILEREEEKCNESEANEMETDLTVDSDPEVADEMGPNVAADDGCENLEVSQTEKEQPQDWSEQDLMNVAGIGELEEFAVKFEKEMLESMMPKDISEWLLQIRLRHFEPIFIEHGYDDIDFIGLDVLTAESLGFIGVKDPATIQKVLTSRVVKNCPRVPRLEDADPPCHDLSEWLNVLKLPQYVTNFAEGGCLSDLSNIEDAWQLVLKKNKFNISCVGHRMRMLASLNIRDLRARMHKHMTDSGAISAPLNGDNLNLEDLQAPTTVEKPMFPAQLSALDTRSFDVGYLGVFPFNNIEPSEKTLIAACQATLDKGVKKVPKIRLQVNFCSIRLSDPNRGVVEIEHAIPNIQCAALNTDHRTFAYVVAERQAARVPINKNSKKTKGKGTSNFVSIPQTQRSQGPQPVLRLCYIFQTIDSDPNKRGGKEVMNAMKEAFLTAFKFVNENQPKSNRANTNTATL